MAESELSKRLRQMTTKLSESLSVVNTKKIATIMWSEGHLNRQEFDAIKACKTNFDAATTLLEHVQDKSDPVIKALAKALRDVELFDLAEELYPVAARVKSACGTMPSEAACGATAAEGAQSSTGKAASTTDVLENLRQNAKNIAERLTLGETDTIIASLRSSSECYLSSQDYEDLKGVAGETRRATALIDLICKKKDKGLVHYFAKILHEELKRKELSAMVLGDTVTEK